MKSLKICFKFSGKVSLLCYIYFFYQLWRLCQYGGLQSYLPRLIVSLAGCCVFFILWLIFRKHKQEEVLKNRKNIFYMEVVLFFLATFYFSGRIIYSALPYNGALSWKIDEWMRKRDVGLQHNNIFKDGAADRERTEEAKDAEGWTVDESDGSVYFFLDDSKGWRLSVADAAAGSRFYVLEKTEDGGTAWEHVNDDPFEGTIGVAEGLVFFDENFGFAGLAGASQSHSQLYVTRDGGKTFEGIQLPMDTVTRLPEHAAEYGLTLEDYDYCCMPKEEDGVLTIKVMSDAGESEGILFRSQDDGMTWEFLETL